jgi:predicted ATPase
VTTTDDPTQTFRRLSLLNWRQFEDVTIDFHPRLTVLTGANGSGKTTVLQVLAKHFNWSRVYSSAPIRRAAVALQVWATLGFVPRDEAGNPIVYATIGRLTYGTGVETELRVPSGEQQAQRQQYDVQFANGPESVTGIFLTSHRFISGNYAQVATIPTLFGGSEQLLEQFTNELRTRWSGGWTGRTPQLSLKESLIAAAVFGEGNQSVEGNPDAAAVWLGFQDVLRQIMPASLAFRRLRIRVPDVLVETDTGDFIFDEISGGISSIIELSWQIFLRSRNSEAFVVLVDEPENHLHPSLQREILPQLLAAFPRVQFIVATHSPFVVTATPDSSVYVLDYNDDRKVESRRLDYANKAASADSTLKRVLGLQSTMPQWAEDRFRQILDKYISTGLNADRLEALRQELEESGMESAFPVAVATATDATPRDAGE